MPDALVASARVQEAGPGYRADRLRRAWQLVKSGRVERLGGTMYRVAGNVEPVYYVDLMGDQMCTCRDMEFRSAEIGQQCKHVLASRLAALDPALLQVIGDALLAAEQSEQPKGRKSA